MKPRVTISILILVLFLPVFVIAQTVDDIPVRLEKLSDSTTVIRIGENYITNVTAIATDKGLVVIDTNNIPSLAPKLRAMIEQEFGRSDFTYVINTHWHWDHTDGNYAFPEATIVGHERCVPDLHDFEAGLPGFIERRKELISNFEKQIPSMDPNNVQTKWLQDVLTFNKILIPELEKGITFVPPNLTFNDRLTLNLGDKTFQLAFIGKVHTDSDIVICVPEEKLLFVGDLFSQGMIPIIGGEVDVPRWLDVLGDFLAEGSDVEQVITGHHQFISGEELRAQYGYVKDLWEGMTVACDEGLSLEDAQERFSFDKKFNHLENLNHAVGSQDFHTMNIQNMWKMLQKE